MERIERMMNNMMEMMKSGMDENGDKGGSMVKQESNDSTVNGVNVMRLPARDAYAFGLQLMDIMFTKDELANALLFASKKSDKPGLDKDRVGKLMGFLEKRYGDQWDIKTLTSKVNQKCRDAKGRVTNY